MGATDRLNLPSGVGSSRPNHGIRVARSPHHYRLVRSGCPTFPWTEARPASSAPQSSSLLMRNGNNIAGITSDGRLKRGPMSENSTHTQSHIDSIAKQEHEFLEQRTFLERVSDRIAGFAGSMFFVLFHILLAVFWVLINANRVSWIPRFDPYPFSLLGMIVAVEAVVLSSFILMRQNRMAKRGERRDHLNLQVDLIAEKEVTKLLQMVQAICEHMGLKHIAEDKEVEEFSQKTSVETLAQRLEDTLPEA